MSRYRDPQLQVTENMCDLRNLSTNISVFQDWKHILLLTTGYTGASKNKDVRKQNVYCGLHQCSKGQDNGDLMLVWRRRRWANNKSPSSRDEPALGQHFLDPGVHHGPHREENGYSTLILLPPPPPSQHLISPARFEFYAEHHCS